MIQVRLDLLALSVVMATYKVTLVNASMGLNRTVDCADDQTIFDAAADQDMTCRSPAVPDPAPPAPAS